MTWMNSLTEMNRPAGGRGDTEERQCKREEESAGSGNMKEKRSLQEKGKAEEKMRQIWQSM